jgi:uncharacterized protein
VLTLYQAEWCPYSAAVREVLTELGLDFVARQVEPEPEDRVTLQAVSGGDSIPVLETEDGEIVRGTRAIFRYLESREPSPYADTHRRKFEEHVHVRRSDGVGKLVARFRHDRPGDAIADGPGAAVVVDVPDESRYEIRLGDRRIGVAAYHRSGSTIAFTHTEVDSACEGRGFGTRLVAEALDDARRQGLEVLPLCSFVAAVVKRRQRA